MIQIVSENSEKDLARLRAEEVARYAVRELTANLIRITRGAGKPHEVGRQAAALVRAMQNHWDAASCWPHDEMADALSIKQSRDWMGSASEDEVARFYAQEQIIAGALQMTASRLVGQRTQESAGESELWRGVYEIERFRAERSKKEAAAARAASKATAKRKPKARKRATTSTKA